MKGSLLGDLICKCSIYRNSPSRICISFFSLFRFSQFFRLRPWPTKSCFKHFKIFFYKIELLWTWPDIGHFFIKKMFTTLTYASQLNFLCFHKWKHKSLDKTFQLLLIRVFGHSASRTSRNHMWNPFCFFFFLHYFLINAFNHFLWL